MSRETCTVCGHPYEGDLRHSCTSNLKRDIQVLRADIEKVYRPTNDSLTERVGELTRQNEGLLTAITTKDRVIDGLHAQIRELKKR